MQPESNLSWDELAQTEGEIPWSVLENFTNTLIETPELWKKLAQRYDSVTITKDYSGYEDLYIPYIFAKAGHQLSEQDKVEIIPFLLEKLSEAGQEDSDYILEAFSAACGCMGPAVLPFVPDAIEKEQNTYGAWVFLWSLLKLASVTKDQGMKNKVVSFCVQHLEQIINGEIKITDGDEAAHILAHLECKEYIPLLEEIEKKSSDTLVYPEYREALRILKGEIPPYEIEELWEGSPEKWLKSSVKAFNKWYQENSKETNAEDEDFQFYINLKISRRFARSKAVENISIEDSEDIYFIADSILSYAWTHKETPPEKLDENTLKEILTELLPRRAVIPANEFQYVPEIASKLLNWLKQQDILEQGDMLAEKVIEWSGHITANGANREFWSTDKKLAMDVIEQGLDIDDPETFKHLVLDYSEIKDVFGDDDNFDEPDYIPKIPIKEYSTKIGRNDPCPCGSGKKYKKCCGRVSMN